LDWGSILDSVGGGKRTSIIASFIGGDGKWLSAKGASRVADLAEIKVDATLLQGLLVELGAPTVVLSPPKIQK
jgi:hypothetical protein